MTLKYQLCALWLLVLSGCYAHYPSSWKPLESAQRDCSSISGTYRPTGSGSRYGVPRLAPRVLQDEKIRLEDAERVELRMENDVMTVAVFSAARQLQARQFLASKGEYICDDSKIRMSHVVVDGFGVRRNRAILSKAADGALVVEDAGEGLGFFFLPIAGSEFLRFEPYVSGQSKGSRPPVDDFVNCSSGGERRWTYRSKCD